MKGAWLFLITTSCATPGRTWVHSAEAPQRPAPSGPSARALAAAEEDDAPRSEPLRRPVITLGARTEPQEDAPPSAASAPGAPVTIVQVNVNSAYPAYGYGGYGYGWGGARPPEPPDHHPGPAPSPTPPMAGNWSAPPSYGPPVMSHTLPADPWR